MHRLIPAAVAALSFAGLAPAQVFTDPAAYDAAVAGSVVPDYSTLAPVDFEPGVVTDFSGLFDVEATGGVTGDADFNSAANFVFDFSPDGLESVEVTFPEPVTGISGVFSNTFVQDGFRVSTPSADYDLNVLVSDLDEAFVGIVEDTPFTSVTFTTSNNIPGDDFVFFTDLTYAPVPEPASLALLGLAGGLLIRRR